MNRLHDVMMAERILKTLRELSKQHKAKVVSANIRVGDMNEPKGVKMWLEKLGGNEFKDTKFKIMPVPLEVTCECGYSGGVGTVAHFHSPNPELEIACPACGGHGLELTSGKELEIVNVELEGGKSG